jgi:endonuclease/exonuclease/phosphatase family metal-dependent hydrolase
MKPMRLRIASWNTWKNEGDYARRLPAMADALRALAPDVVLLQEVFCVVDDGSSPAAAAGDVPGDTGAFLAQATSMQLHFAQARRRLREGEAQPLRDSYSGHAILSRFALTRLRRLELPSSERGGERIALCAALKIDGLSLQFACVHLAHLHEDAALRRVQLDQVLSQLAADAMPAIVGGDFNCERSDWHWRQVAIQEGWTRIDALEALDIRQPTHPVPLQPGRRGRQIDGLLALQPTTAADAARLRLLDGGVTALAAATPGGVCPSDHALVWADWAVEGPDDHDDI